MLTRAAARLCKLILDLLQLLLQIHHLLPQLLNFAVQILAASVLAACPVLAVLTARSVGLAVGLTVGLAL